MRLKDSNYYYLTGKVRHLETFLLNKNDINRMVDAPDAAAAFRVFNDLDYGTETLDLTASEYEKALDAKLVRIKKMLSKTIPDEFFMKFLFYKYDFHNIKVLLKSKYCQIPYEENDLLSASFIPVEIIRHVILDDNYNYDLPTEIITVIKNIKEKISQNPRPHLIDIFCDYALYEILENFSREQSSFLYNLTLLQIDINNIKSFLRLTNFQMTAEEIRFNLIPDGQIDFSALSLSKNITIDEAIVELKKLIMPSVKKYPYSLLIKVMDDFTQDKSWQKLEQSLEEIELSYFAPVKYRGYGIEVITAYFYHKLNMIRNIRLIMTGKFNGFGPEEIRGQLRGI